MMHSARSDIGLVRDTNQDAHACVPERRLFVIADGMGGLARGGEASRLAVDTVLAEIGPHVSDPERELSPAAWESVLSDVIRSAQRAAVADNERFDGTEDMGTTLICAVFAEQRVCYAHSGDSRLYVVSRSATIEQITTDQTLAQRLIEEGEDAASAIALHGHVLTNFVGTAHAFEPAIDSRPIANGATVLLCTDGLSDMVSDDDIAAIVAGNATDAACAALIERAIANGGSDNITAIVIRPGS